MKGHSHIRIRSIPGLAAALALTAATCHWGSARAPGPARSPSGEPGNRSNADVAMTLHCRHASYRSTISFFAARNPEAA